VSIRRLTDDGTDRPSVRVAAAGDDNSDNDDDDDDDDVEQLVNSRHVLAQIFSTCRLPTGRGEEVRPPPRRAWDEMVLGTCRGIRRGGVRGLEICGGEKK